MSDSPKKKQVQEFRSRCRSMLWRHDGGVKKEYERFEARVSALMDRSKYGILQATVQAAKDHKCLKRLFREYDVSAFDPNPDSHPSLVSDDLEITDIKNEEKEQTHRENLQWAIAMAGRYLRTNEEPAVVPNDAAYYLYQQACAEPKDFLSKFNQIESKGDSELDERKKSRNAGKRRIEEIDEMLSMLEEPNPGEEDEDFTEEKEQGTEEEAEGLQEVAQREQHQGEQGAPRA